MKRSRGPRRRRRPPAELRVGGYARYDAQRARRVGTPEVILGEGKRPEHLVGILWALQRAGAGAIVSRVTPVQAKRLDQERARGLRVRPLADARLALLDGPIGATPGVGTAAVLAAGTADVPAAEEARVVLETLGARVVLAYDIGVAGVHRLIRALTRIRRSRPGIYLVFAGREGALPTVVAGLVAAPVVGIPTSVGYGRGGQGEGALTAMLQSCAPIAVVNIDAAVSAALFAVQVLRGRRAR